MLPRMIHFKKYIVGLYGTYTYVTPPAACFNNDELLPAITTCSGKTPSYQSLAFPSLYILIPYFMLSDQLVYIYRIAGINSPHWGPDWRYSGFLPQPEIVGKKSWLKMALKIGRFLFRR